MNGSVRVLERSSVRPGDGLHPGDAGDSENTFGQFVQYQKIRRVAQIVVGLEQQDFGFHPGLGEVPVGRRVSGVGRHVVGYILSVVVAGADNRAARGGR